MKYLHEQFSRILPQIESELVTLSPHIPKLLAQRATFQSSRGPNCPFARATLKLVFVEALHRDGENFRKSLRVRGYTG